MVKTIFLEEDGTLDTQLLQTFLVVAKLENVSQAAEQLRFTQPTVTAQIQALERYFDVELFERVGKRIFLTAAGQRMIPLAEELLRGLNDIHAQMDSFRKTTHPMVLGISTQMINYFLQPIVGHMQSALPGVHISIDVCKNSDEVNRKLLDNQIDVGMIHGPAASPQAAQYEMRREPLLWVVNRDIYEKHQRNTNALAYPIINFTRQGSVFRATFEEAMRGQDYASALEVSDSEAVKQAVLKGLGVSYLPQTLLNEHIANRSLVVLDGPPMSLTISLVLHKNKQITQAIAALLRAVAALSGADTRLQAVLEKAK